MPVYAGAPSDPRLTLIDPTMHIQAHAAFGEANYAITDAWKLTAGVRYSYEKREIDQELVLPTVTIAYEDKKNFKKWTPRVSLQYRINDQASVYASYSKGFKSGVFNVASAVPNVVNPEQITAYELGIKTDPAPWLRINAAAFYYDYKDLQVGSRVGTVLVFQNAARAKPRGFEVDLTAKPAPGWTVRLGGSYLHAKYDSFPGAFVFVPLPQGGNRPDVADATGSKMVRAPNYQLNGSIGYERNFDSGTLNVDVSGFYSGEVFFDFDNRIRQSPYGVLNSSVTYTLTNGIYVGLWGRNLTDEVYGQNYQTLAQADKVSYGRPREYGVSAGWKF